MYVLIKHINHIIILLVYIFLIIMNKTTKIQKVTGGQSDRGQIDRGQNDQGTKWPGDKVKGDRVQGDKV
jgi:hypothetical protein